MIGTPWHNLAPFKIISSQAITGESGRWEYTVQVVEYGSSVEDVPDVPIVPAGGPVQYKAYNMYEYANTTTSHMGIDPATLPGLFELKPIPNDSIVPAFIAAGTATDANATNGTMVMLLWPNQFEGTC